MTLVYILIAVTIVGVLLFYAKRKQSDTSPVIRERVLSESNTDSNIKISVTDGLIDLNQVRAINAKKVLKSIGNPKTLEQKLILSDPTGFTYFARFFMLGINH